MVIISDIQLPKDANGILKVSDVSNSADSDLSARTDPNNAGTRSFIKCDTNNNLAVYLANAEGGGELNATEYPAVQVAGFDGESFSSLQVGRTGRLETFGKDSNGSAQALLGSAGATAILGDSTITPTADPENRDGWNFVNSVAGTKFNLYYFNGTQEIITLADISSVFAKVYINNFASLSGSPFFHIYTKPTGSGDAGAFYHSRIDYEIDSSVIVGIGEQVILWGENKPNTPCNNRLIQLKNKTVNGDGAGTEEILYITLSSNSGATINTKNITVTSMGFNTGDMGGTNGVINREFKLVTGGNGGATEATLSALNSKISKGNDSSLTDAQQVLIYGKNGTGALKPIHITNNGDVEVEIADFVKGQATSANSFPVVLSSDQSAVNVKNTTRSSGALFGSTTLNDDSFTATSSVDLTDFKQVHIFGKNTVAPTDLKIYGSLSSSGSFYYLGSINGSMFADTVTEGAISKYYYDKVIDNPPPFIRIFQNSGSQTTFNLDYVATRI